jgi:hypothetical protein
MNLGISTAQINKLDFIYCFRLSKNMIKVNKLADIDRWNIYIGDDGNVNVSKTTMILRKQCV